MGAFFLTLILILSLTSGDVLDGQYWLLNLLHVCFWLLYNLCIFQISLSNEKYEVY